MDLPTLHIPTRQETFDSWLQRLIAEQPQPLKYKKIIPRKSLGIPEEVKQYDPPLALTINRYQQRIRYELRRNNEIVVQIETVPIHEGNIEVRINRLRHFFGLPIEVQDEVGNVRVHHQATAADGGFCATFYAAVNATYELGLDNIPSSNPQVRSALAEVQLRLHWDGTWTEGMYLDQHFDDPIAEASRQSLLADLQRGMSEFPQSESISLGPETATLRLNVEDIDSFQNIKAVSSADISSLLTSEGYLEQSEEFIQSSLEQILNVLGHQKDWGGEINDLYTTNVMVSNTRVATAFLLKGNGLRKSTLEIANCGRKGDQIIRLFESPAELFILQFVGKVSEAVIKDVASHAVALRAQGKPARYCILNGQDTARLLRAYGKL